MCTLFENDNILPISGRRNVLVTSALPYVNNIPHLGNIIGSVLSADVFARFCRLRNHNVIYISGTDEYGTATEQKAAESGVTCIDICDKYHKIHASTYEWFNIKFDYFGRTTTSIHTDITQDIFNKIDSNQNLIEKDQIQLFCPCCNTLLADRFVVGICPNSECSHANAHGDQCDKCGTLYNSIDLINSKCTTCNSKPVQSSSKHIFLDLKKIAKEQLEHWTNVQSLRGNWSENACAITKSWFMKHQDDRCITRDLKWGTQVPKNGYKDKVFHVWFDAPIGYISIMANYSKHWKRWWQSSKADAVELYQFMGKDNISFHTIMFPATLMATKDNWTMLKHINATEYLNYENKKFSKSRNVGIFGDQIQKLPIHPDVFRYYLLFNRPESSDSMFTWTDFASKNNADLGNNFGNLVQRTLSFVSNKFQQIVPPLDVSLLMDIDITFISHVTDLLRQYVNLLEAVKIKDALKIVMSISKSANIYLQETKVWLLVKKKDTLQQCYNTINITVNVIYLLGILLQPYMPVISCELIQNQLKSQFDQFYLAKPVCKLEFDMKSICAGHKIGIPKPLFRQIDEKEIQLYKDRFGN